MKEDKILEVFFQKKVLYELYYIYIYHIDIYIYIFSINIFFYIYIYFFFFWLKTISQLTFYSHERPEHKNPKRRFDIVFDRDGSEGRRTQRPFHVGALDDGSRNHRTI